MAAPTSLQREISLANFSDIRIESEKRTKADISQVAGECPPRGGSPVEITILWGILIVHSYAAPLSPSIMRDHRKAPGLARHIRRSADDGGDPRKLV